jgi:hypothetical protein
MRELSYNQLQSIALEINETCNTEIKRNDKKNILTQAIVETSQTNVEAMDIWLSNYLTDEVLISQASDMKALDLKRCLARVNDILESRINSTKAVTRTPRNTASKETLQRGVSVLPENRELLPRKIDKTISEISVNSPNLKASFNDVGFTDQNGTVYRGQVAERVLTELWLSDNPVIKPPLEVKTTGYRAMAIVEIAPETKEVIDKDGNVSFRPIFISNQKTIVENNKVLNNSANHGHATRVYDLRPLFTNNAVNLENIVKVDWIVTATEDKRQQNKTVSSYRKNSVKTKISWKTRYIAVDFNPTVSYGKLITLPLDDKTIKCRLVLEVTGSINLYRNDVLWLTVGRYSVQYDHASNTLLATGDHFSKNVKPEWYPILDKHIQDLIASNSHIVDRHNEKTFLELLAYDEYRRCLGKKLDNKQYRKIRSKARKAIFKIYLSNPDALAYDLQKVCHRLHNDKSLDDNTRSFYNKCIIGYAHYKGLIKI